MKNNINLVFGKNAYNQFFFEKTNVTSFTNRLKIIFVYLVFDLKIKIILFIKQIAKCSDLWLRDG